MRLPRRNFLHLAAGAAALPAASRFAWADTYPSRPVHIIVGFPPGGTVDIVARLMGQSLSDRLGQQFVVENRPGASSNIAAEAVVRAPADGYTLLMVTGANVVNAVLYEKLNFDLFHDLAPVAGVADVPFVLEVNPSVPAKTVPEFIAYAKANPGKINFASAGNGSPQHVAGELFNMLTGVKMVHVPYRGSAPALSDLLGGQVQVAFDALPVAMEYIRTARLRALAVMSVTRSEALPDVPTVAEFVPGYEASGWAGVGAPRNTPVEIIDKLNKEINAGLADPKIRARFSDLGLMLLLARTPSEFDGFITKEADKWAKVVKFANIKPE